MHLIGIHGAVASGKGCGVVNDHASENRLQLGEDDPTVHNDGSIEVFSERLLTLLNGPKSVNRGDVTLVDVAPEVTTVG